jgi:hypothetical protein
MNLTYIKNKNMKTTNLLKSIAITASVLLMGSALSAQVTGVGPLVPPTGINVTDSVTIGSTMPYQVSGDINMHALRSQGVLTASHFTWTVPAGGTLHNNLGAGVPLATDTTVSVNWTATGAQTISTVEVPQVASGPAFSCTANTSTLNILVLNRPTIAWNGITPAGGCGVAGTTVNIPVTLNGTGQFAIYYKIQYTTLAGVVSTPVDNTVTPFTTGTYQNGSQTINLTYAIPAGNYGTYTVIVTQIADRISTKSGVASQASDIPATNYVIVSYPTPVTSPITHIKNL